MIKILVILAVAMTTFACDAESDRGNSGNLDAGTKWMELPAMNDSSLDYYTHSFIYNRKTYRNYSFGWSQSDLVSHWVAYPLCRFYSKGDVLRTEEWQYDPLLGEMSSNPGPGYGGSYTRGHQVPSGDRKCCEMANRQTFYGTNITPQLYNHNGGIWLELENKVRAIANRADTVYVVSGCIVANSNKIVSDSDGKDMIVPTAYYKALLRYKKTSDSEQWDAAAFYLEHRKYSEPLSKCHSMSIDELEKMTGMDFFVNLQTVIGKERADEIESRSPEDSAVWW